MRTFLKKYVESRGTQSIIKNLNLKKSKRSWNEYCSERNGYTVQTNYFIFILSIFQIANILCPFKFLCRCTKKKKKTWQKPLHALFSAKLFFSMNQRTDFDAYFIDLFQKLQKLNWAIWCLNILFWFPIITQWIPPFPRSVHAWTYVSSHAILWHVNMKHSKFCSEKDFQWISANNIYQNCEHELQIYCTIWCVLDHGVLNSAHFCKEAILVFWQHILSCKTFKKNGRYNIKTKLTI